MTKKQIKAQNNKNRVMVNFNTGTRTHSTLKDYDRKKSKKELRKMLDNYQEVWYTYYSKRKRGNAYDKRRNWN